MRAWEDLGFDLVVKLHEVEKAEPELHVVLPEAKDELEKVRTYLAEQFTLRDVRRVAGVGWVWFSRIGSRGAQAGGLLAVGRWVVSVC